MIKGLHAMFYSSHADELRAFFRDKLGFPFTDVGDGWLIFDMPEADLGCHPVDEKEGAPSGTADTSTGRPVASAIACIHGCTRVPPPVATMRAADAPLISMS